MFSKREVLIFIAITLLLLGIAVALTFVALDKADTKNVKYERAIILDSDEQISYAYQTATGYCFSTSKILPYENNYITDTDNSGNFVYIKMAAYAYEKKTRAVKDKDGKTHTETYYEWVYKSYRSWEKCVDKFLYSNDVIVNGKEICSLATHINTEYDYYYGTRYKYEYYGVYFDNSDYTMFANFCDIGTVDEIQFGIGSDIEKVKDSFTKYNKLPIFFIWFGFALLECICVFLFYKYENNWLED